MISVIISNAGLIYILINWLALNDQICVNVPFSPNLTCHINAGWLCGYHWDIKSTLFEGSITSSITKYCFYGSLLSSVQYQPVPYSHAFTEILIALS